MGNVGNVIFEGGGGDVEAGLHMLEALGLVRAERDSREAGDLVQKVEHRSSETLKINELHS